MRMKCLKKILKISINILSYLVFAVGLIAFIMVLVTGKKGVPQIFGYRILTVETGSMEPVYCVGSIVFVKDVDMKTLSVGDDICFYSKDPEILNKPNTHRIYKIELDGNNERYFVTKGIANDIPDDYSVGRSQLIGKVVAHSNIIGKIYKIFSKGWVMFLALILPLMIIVCTEMVNIKKIVASGKDTDEADKSETDK